MQFLHFDVLGPVGGRLEVSCVCMAAEIFAGPFGLHLLAKDAFAEYRHGFLNYALPTSFSS